MNKHFGIIVKTQVSGTHSWNNVVNNLDLSNVYFLQYEHFHIFHIKCYMKVTHEDRDVEIINLKTKIDKYLSDTYYVNKCGYCVFNQKSCEMLAEELVDKFNLSKCEVLEDGNFGGFCEMC